jgi:hypothetical protein
MMMPDASSPARCHYGPHTGKIISEMSLPIRPDSNNCFFRESFATMESHWRTLCSMSSARLLEQQLAELYAISGLLVIHECFMRTSYKKTPARP